MRLAGLYGKPHLLAGLPRRMNAWQACAEAPAESLKFAVEQRIGSQRLGYLDGQI